MDIITINQFFNVVSTLKTIQSISLVTSMKGVEVTIIEGLYSAIYFPLIWNPVYYIAIHPDVRYEKTNPDRLFKVKRAGTGIEIVNKVIPWYY